MSDLDEDLRATSEDLHEDAKNLEEIEEEKSRLDPRDPRTADLSEEGERVTKEMVTKAGVERRLVEQANAPDESDNGRPQNDT